VAGLRPEDKNEGTTQQHNNTTTQHTENSNQNMTHHVSKAPACI
jgi:hypothetical protein